MRLSDAEARVYVYGLPFWRLLCQSCNLNNNHNDARLSLNGEKTKAVGNLKPFRAL